jgi:hypothetical protein
MSLDGRFPLRITVKLDTFQSQQCLDDASILRHLRRFGRSVLYRRRD